MEVKCIYTHEDSIMKPTKHCLRKERKERVNGNITEGVNLFKLHCTHVWNYHDEILSYY
jgi:hypothetical protein